MENLEKERAEITKELVQLHYFFWHEMLKEKKNKRLDTYHDWLYSISGNCLNATIVNNCRILLENIKKFSLKNKKLLLRAEKLNNKALKIKEDIYKLSPINRGVAINKEWAKMFSGKNRKIFNKALKTSN